MQQCLAHLASTSAARSGETAIQVPPSSNVTVQRRAASPLQLWVRRESLMPRPHDLSCLGEAGTIESRPNTSGRIASRVTFPNVPINTHLIFLQTVPDLRRWHTIHALNRFSAAKSGTVKLNDALRAGPDLRPVILWAKSPTHRGAVYRGAARSSGLRPPASCPASGDPAASSSARPAAGGPRCGGWRPA